MGPLRDEYQASFLRVAQTPKIAVGYEWAFLTLRRYARRPGRSIEVPIGPPPQSLRAATVVGSRYATRLVGPPTVLGLRLASGLTLAPRERHSVELGPDGARCRGEVPGPAALGFGADLRLS